MDIIDKIISRTIDKYETRKWRNRLMMARQNPAICYLGCGSLDLPCKHSRNELIEKAEFELSVYEK